MKVDDRLVKYLKPDMTSDNTYEEIVHRINQRALSSRGGKILIKVDDYERVGGLDYIKFDKDNISQIFLQRAWKHTSLEDKIKACNMQIAKNLTVDGKLAVNKLPRFSLIKRSCDKPNTTYRMYYALKENVVWADVAELDKMPGVEIYSTLAHECKHALDHEELDSLIIPELIKRYCPNLIGRQPNTLPVARAIINMPISGKIYDAVNNRLEDIDKNLQNTILFAKNRYAIATPSKTKRPADVHGIIDMNDYIGTIMYYYSPLEKRARDKQFEACQELTTQANKKNISIDDEDAQDFVVTNNDKCDFNVDLASVILDRPVAEAFDTYVKYTFYSTNAGTLKYYMRDKSKFDEEFSSVQKDMQELISNTYNNLQERRRNKTIADPDK